ncbi:TPA: hypothetical protein JTK35_004451 [Escherichia coli]|nr:hypothetical protein [Escherichia coli]
MAPAAIPPPTVEPIVAIPDAPATVDAVETAVPAIVDGLVILIFLLQIEQIQLNYLLNNLTTISLPW